jgi:hypothetical protein
LRQCLPLSPINKINQPPGKANFPDTPEGKLARGLFDAVNSGDKAAVERFITDNLSNRALKEDPPGEYVDNIQRLYQQSGGFELMQILPARAPGEVRITARTKRGNYWVQMMTRLEKDEPTKLDGFGFRRIADPESEKSRCLVNLEDE